MRDKIKKEDIWKGAWTKVLISIVCLKHKDVKKVVLLNDYTEALDKTDRNKKWFCKQCGKRLVMYYGDYNEKEK